MRNTSRLAGGAVVLAAVVIAACYGEAKLASSRHAVIVPDRDPVFIGSAMVGSSVTTSPPITLSPQTETSDDTIISITKTCGSDFTLLGTGSGARVYCSAEFGSSTSGSGACVPVSYSFNATFTPAGPGSASCGVVVAYAPTGGGSASTRTIMLNGFGVAPSYALSVTPATINFSDHPIGSTSAATPVMIKNVGSMALTVNGSNSNGSNFSIASGSGSTFANQALAPGQDATYAVSCTPQSLGPISGTLTFSSPAGPKTVGLSCNGIGVSSLEISPVPAAFAPTLVGRAPPEVVVTIKNNGSLPTTLSVSLAATSPDLAFAAGGNPNGTDLPVGESTTVRLQYAAATEHAAGALGTLTVGYSGGTARNITINGTALVGDVGWAPAGIAFGPVCVGATARLPVSVYASAAGSVEIETVSVVAPFDVTRAVGSLKGNHGNMLDFTASVTPTVPGELTGSFTLNTNLPTNPARSIPLTATALPRGVSPTPDLVHFGPGRVGMTSAAKTIELSNCGDTPINITAARIEGASATDFTLVSPENPAMTLPQMGSQKFLVVMSPRENGTKAAQLVIEYDGGTVVAELDGNGFGGDDGELLDRGTYYACSTGHGSPAALAPLALALLLLRRRRRA